MKAKIFRYVGSKFKYLDLINNLIYKSNGSVYAEPFLGSGVVYLNLIKNFNRYYINDIDRNIIQIFLSYKKSSFENIQKCIRYVDEKFGDIAKNKESFYFFRNWFNEKLWKSDTIYEGIFLSILISASINSLYRFGPNGYNSSFGNRNLIKNYTEDEHYIIRKKLNNNTIITNYSFNDFLNFISSEKEKITYFLDPPYLNGNDISYLKHFSKDDYKIFFNYLINTKNDVIYTDIYTNKLKWNYYILRDKLNNVSPNRKKETNSYKEVVFFNF